MRRHSPVIIIFILITTHVIAAQTKMPDLRKTALKSATPSDEIVHVDINGDGKPDILERWWNGKRVRWLDENGDMLPTDTRGDQVGDVMQIDKNGDGLYEDRKSTRLNSSHSQISYAVFCLKKKKNNENKQSISH